MVHLIDNAVIFGDTNNLNKRPNHIDDLMMNQKKADEDNNENNEVVDRPEDGSIKEVEFAKDFKVGKLVIKTCLSLFRLKYFF